MTNASRLEFDIQSSPKETIGLDLSDVSGTYVVVDAMSRVTSEGKLGLTQAELRKFFARREPTRVAIEVGQHSHWVSRELTSLGHEVVVANPRQVKLISQNKKKNDRQDAELLARLARFDPALLKPVRHRGEQAQADLALLRSRDCLVRSRTSLINHIRGAVKTTGGRIHKCSAEGFSRKAKDNLPPLLQSALMPVVSAITQLTEQIDALTKELERVAKRYSETELLRQVKGVGLLTSLAFVLILEEPQRFTKSRSVGAFLGLTTRQAQSGEREPQMHITKAGDALLRRLLVQSAQYILGPFGQDCDLRRWGQKLAGDSNKIRKRKAVIAVARKLTTLLHHLWANAVVYEPFRSRTPGKEAA